MDLYTTFAVDAEKMAAGVWHVIEETTDYPVAEAEIGDKVAVLIGGVESPRYRQLLERKMKPIVMRRGADVDLTVREKVTAEAIAECVILDWRNWIIQGTAWPYTKENVLKIWLEPQWIGLKSRLLAIIGDTDIFKIAHEEAVIKN